MKDYNFYVYILTNWNDEVMYIGTEHIELEKISVIEAPGVTHLRFRVPR